jgi:rfaE bifunctional protein kinase chain/domain
MPVAIENNTALKLRLTEVESVLDGFAGKKIMVIGDVMADSYWWGKVERISPEAPVPVVSINRREYRLGGAANVALNLKMLGAEPLLYAITGHDKDGEVFMELLEDAKICGNGILKSKNRPTTVKTRIIGNGNQLLRVDSEEDSPVSQDDSDAFKEKVLSAITEAELILFEDYDKGLITRDLIDAVIKTAQSLKIPVVVDPKKRNFLHYRHATLFKPNLRELAEGLKIDLDSSSTIEEIEKAACILREKLDAGCVLITLSERGVLVCSENESHLIPAHVRNIYDVSGAGDTVVSVAALALLAGASWPVSAALANLAGGLVCEKSGVVPIALAELKQEAIKEFCA